MIITLFFLWWLVSLSLSLSKCYIFLARYSKNKEAPPKEISALFILILYSIIELVQVLFKFFFSFLKKQFKWFYFFP